MNIEQLNYFFKAANCGSFSSAANEIFTTPQNLSKAISKLEIELDTKLFNRYPQGVQLTSDGLLFYEKVAHLLEEYNDLKAVFAKKNTSTKTELNVCSTINFNTTFLPEILHRIYKLYPNLDINIREENMDSIFSFVQKNNYLGIGFFLNGYFSDTLLKRYSNDISFESIYSSKVGICANKHHEIAQKKIVTLNEAFAYPFILNTQSNWTDIGFNNIHPHKIINTTSQELIDFLTTKNKAITFALKDFLFEKNLSHLLANQLTYIPLKEDISVSVIIFKNIFYPLTEIENTFIAIAREIAKELQIKHKIC